MEALRLSPAAIVLEGPRLASAGNCEWVLTNGLGGFAMGSAWGIPDRRYHGLLIGALNPPLGRFVALNAIDDSLVVESAGSTGCVALNRHRLSVFRFGGSCASGLPTGLVRFIRDGDSSVWEYRPGGESTPVFIRRELRLTRGANISILKYTVEAPNRRAWLEIRPLTAMRDFHALRHEHDSPPFGLSVGEDADTPDEIELRAEGVRLNVRVQGARFIQERNWWRNFQYARDLARGQDGHEDLFCPGVFVAECGRGTSGTVIMTAEVSRVERDAGLSTSLSAPTHGLHDAPFHPADRTVSRVRVAGQRPINAKHARAMSMLEAAADQFIVTRAHPDGSTRGTSIIAGYPWFSDWGRDTFISLPGLLLCTGRFHEARRTLESFASLRSRGLIPNCFDNGSGVPEYNSADAPLWFVHAACAYHRETKDRQGLVGEIMAACIEIARWYLRGTDHGIGVDPDDGLVRAGNEGTQLTWMDAKRDGVVFTPRHGKPIELSALWCSVLAQLIEALGTADRALQEEFRSAAAQCAESINRKFWNASEGCLYDRLTPDDSPVPEIRPNMIFAASLPSGVLPQDRVRSVLRVVQERLLTPMGLRTLDPRDPAFRPRYEGSLFERDRAYHNGTVWPWLIGPYAEAVLRVGGFSDSARKEAEEAMTPLLDELLCEDMQPSASILQLPEVYDGDDAPERPRRADGCMAQAWSVAELLRVLSMIVN